MASSRTVISNPKALAAKTAAMSLAGSGSLQVISNFDKTITTAFVGGRKILSLVAILREDGFLTPDYPEKAQILFERYHPSEIDPNLPLSEKKRLMDEWWRQHFDLLIASGLSREDIRRAMLESGIRFRTGADSFLSQLESANIPLTIFSASGLGGESISFFLDHKRRLSSNIHIVSNDFSWDESGSAISIKEPVIHSLNKDVSILESYPFFKGLASRRQALLLCDSLSDVAMADSLSLDNIIKVGFLNDNVERSLEDYSEAFDVVITDDGPFDFLLGLLSFLH